MPKPSGRAFSAHAVTGIAILALVLLASPAANAASDPSSISGGDQYVDPLPSAAGPVVPGTAASGTGRASARGQGGSNSASVSASVARQLGGPGAVALQRLGGGPLTLVPARQRPGLPGPRAKTIRSAAPRPQLGGSRRQAPTAAGAVLDAVGRAGGAGILLLALVLATTVAAFFAGSRARLPR